MWIWSWWDEIPRTSSLKYDAKICSKINRFDSKWQTSCWCYGMGPRDFLVHLDMMHMCTEFHLDVDLWQGAQFYSFDKGALHSRFTTPINTNHWKYNFFCQVWLACKIWSLLPLLPDAPKTYRSYNWQGGEFWSFAKMKWKFSIHDPRKPKLLVLDKRHASFLD